MSLIRKKPSYKKGDLLRPKEVAEILGVDVETIRSGSVGNFTLIPLNDSKRPPYVIRREEVERFIEQRIEMAEKRKKG